MGFVSRKLLAKSKKTTVVPPVVVEGDTYWNNSVLLLKADTSDNQTNNSFLDSSTNNFTITRNGTPTQGSFSPYGNSWSNYFNGNGDRLRLPTPSSVSILTGDFTIECWVNPSSYPTTGALITTIVSQYQQSIGQGGYSLGYNNTGQVFFSFGAISESSNIIVSSNSIGLNTWTHLSVCRQGSIFTLYINGVSAGTYTSSATRGALTVDTTIGNYLNSSGTFPAVVAGQNVPDLNGYISNLRIVKGTAIYTSNFNPPTSPLTAVAGTSLLTCQSNRFVDNSSNNFAITANGTPSVQPHSPFGQEYSIATNGGSAYFDGSGDYLLSPVNSAFAFGTGDFTIDFWMYPYATGAWNSVCGTQVGAVTNQAGWIIAIPPGGGSVQFWGSGQFTTAPISMSSWTHVAVSRASSSLKVFVNGALTNTVSEPDNHTYTQLAIGATGNSTTIVQPYNGYISNFRVIKGTALYSSSFTPPTSPVTAVANTSLLCNFTNAGIFDSTTKNNLETAGTAKVSTSIKKYGSGSMYFDGTGDYLTSSRSTDLSFDTNDFTIECWFYASSLSPTNYSALMGFHNFLNASTWGAYVRTNGVFLYGSGAIIFGGGTVNTGTWYHFAATRFGNTARVFLNGVQQASATVTGSYIGGGYLFRIAEDNEPTNPAFNGYIDDLRITKGIARYTSNFTPPGALPSGPIYTIPSATLELNDSTGYLVQEDDSLILADT